VLCPDLNRASHLVSTELNPKKIVKETLQTSTKAKTDAQKGGGQVQLNKTLRGQGLIGDLYLVVISIHEKKDPGRSGSQELTGVKKGQMGGQLARKKR